MLLAFRLPLIPPIRILVVNVATDSAIFKDPILAKGVVVGGVTEEIETSVTINAVEAALHNLGWLVPLIKATN